MHFKRGWHVSVIALCSVVSFGTLLAAQEPSTAGQYPASLLKGLHWRDVGPMRGGRSYAVAGNADQPDTFYMGSVGGGVWKTENAGRTWVPIADNPKTGIPIGSIGAIAVAPSDPNIVYVGTGEPDIRAQISYGIGVFKSTDAGKTWHSIGLTDTRHIGKIVVDPRDPNRVYVAALGHVYDGNSERGVFRSTDGGAHWKKILFSKTNPDGVGAIDLAIDPKDPRTLYASLWATRRPPWSVYAPTNLPGGGLFKSTDGGNTWHELGGGLPDDDYVGKIGIAISPSNPNRLYAAVDDVGAAVAPPLRMGGGRPGANAPKPSGGIYISDDAGATWRLVNNEERLWGRGWYFEQMAVDPTDPDRAYDINTSTYMTLDAGKTWAPVKGAPGGDDYHQIWVNPKDGNRMVLSSDQGTVVSVDGAKTWSTWYNQPTAEIYHLAATSGYPYWIYGAQQDSGAVGVRVWSDRSVLSFRSWLPSCLAGESDTVVPDPKDGDILYGGGAGVCDQALNVRVRRGELPPPDPNDPNRKTWTLPEVFSKADGALYYSNQFVFRSRDRGRTWEKISPDLTRMNPGVPKNLDPITAKDIDERMTDRFGVVYSIGPSPLDAKTVWAGTSDGLIQVTRDDGANWENVTPPELTAFSRVTQVEAGHFDVDTAYASVDRRRLGDTRPYIYRTHDGGKTWQDVTSGIPDGAYVNSVKEDPEQKGLLYAATELRVYVSFDDGGQWQPLELNMPVTSVRDVIVHGDDLDVATHGRGFWVLDQMSALRQIAAKGQEIESDDAYLFVPGVTYDLRAGGQDGTPLPHEEPQEKNPPAGIVAYYWLKSAAASPIKIELVNAEGKVAACLASDAPFKPVDTETINVQAYWLEPTPPPSAAAGMHRVALDIAVPRFGFGGRRGAAAPPVDACHPAGTPAPRAEGRPGPGGRRGPAGLQAGDYTVRLTVDGKSYTQPVTVKPDPRQLPAGAEPGAAGFSNDDE
ncbi:MAG: WD40/YVTN/BNR-like repeat-containing protein [Terracidiphilus sp.]